MKSLTTVIEVLESCQNDAIECFECPMRHETECEVKIVALAYLKEYQSAKDDLDEKRLKYMKAMTELEDNLPLTWDELKQMEGKPVWVEEYDPIDDNIGWHKCKWYLVNFVNDEFFYVCDNDGDENHFCLAEIGKTWTAYRKERK